MVNVPATSKAAVIIHPLLCGDTRLEWTLVLHVLVAAKEFPKGSVSMRTRGSVIQLAGREEVKLRGRHLCLSLVKRRGRNNSEISGR